MPALPTGVTQEDFYGDDSLWGGYQYTNLSDIINNFILMYTGDDHYIPATINRDVIIFHAKRGLQELNYDVLNSLKAIEVDINPDTLQLTLPEDFVNYVRVSWVDDRGRFRPMATNDDTRIAKAYLQDDQYELMYDEDGAILKAEQNTYDQTMVRQDREYTYDPDDNVGARFGLDTSKAAMGNGWVTVDKASGVMKFSSNVGTKTVVLEYISDGLESADLSDIRVHKFAEEALYSYMEWQIVSRLRGVQEYVVRRKHKYAHSKKLQAKSRLNGIRYEDMLQTLRGRDRTIK